MDYCSQLMYRGGLECGKIVSRLGSMSLGPCNFKSKRVLSKSGSLCQTSQPGFGQSTQPPSSLAGKQTGPSLVKINVTTSEQDMGLWWPVTCPSGHLTHIFLACDVITLCWARHDVTFGVRPESWALPTSQSCPVQLGMTSLPPSFPCGSEEQRVPYSLVCDHRRDCLDGSDETFCTFLSCH